MTYKTFFSYLIAILTGVMITSIFFFWQKNMPPKEVVSTHEHVHEQDHKHDEEHLENRVIFNEEQIRTLGLKFETAGDGSIDQTLIARGKIILHPDRIAHIIPKFSGVAIEADKNIGDGVDATELLAVLESHEMADVKAAFLAALSKLKLAQNASQREEKLYKEKISSEEEYLRAKNVYDEADINLQLSQQKLQSFGLTQEEIKRLANREDTNLSHYLIRSPLSGTIIMRDITKGEFVDTTAAIYEVADLSSVWVEIGIYPKDLSLIKVGQAIEVIMPVADKKYQARVIFVSPVIADETITAKAIAELDNSEHIWRPGTFVKIEISIKKRNFPLVIPLEALQNSGGEDFIFIVTTNGFEKRVVKIGEQDEKNVAITSGLQPGERYVSNQTFLLKAELGKSTAEHEH